MDVPKDFEMRASMRMCGRVLCGFFLNAPLQVGEWARFNFVGLGEDNLIRLCRLVQDHHHAAVIILETVAGVYEDQYPPQVCSPNKIGLNQEGPFLNLRLWRASIAVPRKIGDHQLTSEIEKVNLLSTTWRV